MNPGKFNYPPVPQVLDQNQAPAPEASLDQMPDLSNVRSNLDINMKAPDSPFGLPEATQAVPSAFQRPAAPSADRFAGVKAAANGGDSFKFDIPATARAARRTLEEAGISNDVAAEWRETAQAQWEEQNGRDPKSQAAKAALAQHLQTMRMVVDGKFDPKTEEEK